MTTPVTPRPIPRRVALIGWHAIALVLLTAGLSQLVFAAPVWQLPRQSLLQVVAGGAAYIAVVAVLALLRRRNAGGPGWVVPAGTAAVGIVVLAFLLADLPFSRRLALSLVVGIVCFAALPRLTWSYRIGVVLLATLAAGLVAKRATSAAIPGTEPDTHALVSALADLTVTTWSGRAWPPGQEGGAIQVTDEGFLAMDGDGRFIAFAWDAAGEPAVTRLVLHAPVNFDVYDRDSGGLRVAYRAADLLVQDLGPSLRILVSHHYWNSQQSCWVARLSETIVPEPVASFTGKGDWRTVFESQPCLQLNRVANAGPWEQMGGALVLLDDRHVLFACGDNAFDGVNAEPAFSQDPAVNYGKTVLIDLETGASEVYSSGHRNSLGAVRDASGTIWMTEMGPQGGDELNRIRQGANYGWPNVTMGTEYGGTMWPAAAEPGNGPFEPPIYSWVPSVAPSGIIEAGDSVVGAWRGDLLVATLKARSLLRIRIDEGRVVSIESIPLGFRIRDLAEGHGRLVLWDDQGNITSVTAGSATNGVRLWGRCSACHQLGNGQEHGVGPDLAGIVGRDVASAPGYAYSDALRGLGGRWTEERLSAFLADPQAFAPGTAMPPVDLPTDRERSLLIEYLEANAEH